jgi:glyoxalase family protein
MVLGSELGRGSCGLHTFTRGGLLWDGEAWQVAFGPRARSDGADRKMNKVLRGIHHITAITADPQRNVDFYAGLLGLRFVKKTVNFDDPGSYHLYYGDEEGHPGTIMTFFGWPGAQAGKRGTGQITTVSFSIPPGSVGFWLERLRAQGLNPVVGSRLDEEVIYLSDPDGLSLELVASGGGDDRIPPDRGPIDPQHAIRGFHSASLMVSDPDATAELLTSTMGFRALDEEGNRFRFEVGDGGPAGIVDLVDTPKGSSGIISAGTVHHMAYRTPDDDQQLAWRDTILDQGVDVTHVYDRKYFHSIYFREPGNVLFEIATDPPGFTVDEPVDKLGSSLKLPPALEPIRAELERRLPPISVPDQAAQ